MSVRPPTDDAATHEEILTLLKRRRQAQAEGLVASSSVRRAPPLAAAATSAVAVPSGRLSSQPDVVVAQQATRSPRATLAEVSCAPSLPLRAALVLGLPFSLFVSQSAAHRQQQTQKKLDLQG